MKSRCLVVFHCALISLAASFPSLEPYLAWHGHYQHYQLAAPKHCSLERKVAAPSWPTSKEYKATNQFRLRCLWISCLFSCLDEKWDLEGINENDSVNQPGGGMPWIVAPSKDVKSNEASTSTRKVLVSRLWQQSLKSCKIILCIHCSYDTIHWRHHSWRTQSRGRHCVHSRYTCQAASKQRNLAKQSLSKPKGITAWAKKRHQ